MKVCAHCGKENPDDFDFCRYCGNPVRQSQSGGQKKIWSRLPSWMWIVIIAGGIVLGLAILIGSFVAIATVEGIASIILLVLGVIGFGVYPLRKPENPGAFFRAIGILFFALMGASVDQTGNYLYNKPVEVCFCENGTTLNRHEDVSNPLPGTTYIQQDFTCYSDLGDAVKTINVFAVMGIRFVEYILLGYLLLWIRKLIWDRRNKQ